MRTIDSRLDRLLEIMDDPADLEAWAATHGTAIDLDEYRETLGEDSLPDALEQPTYGCVENDDREAWIGSVGGAIRVTATNTGNCVNNYAALAWDVDADELPEVDEGDE